MAVKSIGEYPTIMKDSVDKFHGNQLVFIYWYAHFMEGSIKAFALSPDMPFSAIMSDIIPLCYKVEPDFEKLDFDNTEVIWEIDGKVITPDPNKSLKENSIGHKSYIQFSTPALDGKIGA
ncbi:phenol hydroxylase subunit P4 [Halarcobacter anaerophilus]|jgi:phenol hydroxylase P4 protein|uniref:phenol hydroxylase subunit P4 n=1 Tax=Halarcobacter anaerophilus TaxID=877500 RepID=UPI0005C8CE54|nr:phenol hydroxylase subunit P4 [Halarcobacter anaerophilus]